ncbi:MAG: glycine--tRNA ligase [Kiritimatiellae bacterium]|nr:glycine--tRNA ligase [Kiritimatiellia bacterium]
MEHKDSSPQTMDTLVSLCKRRGFIFQSSEIYGGINGFWDYGPLGCELKRNIRDSWWRAMVRRREDVVGLDATIIMHPAIWKASGHADGFADPMVDCKACRHRFRADQLCEEHGLALLRTAGGFALPPEVKCTHCGSKDLTEPRAFNLMFKTYVGPVEEEGAAAYLRPETAQAIFAQFRNVLETSRQSVPFGVAQMGKSFRNEINPRNFTFRSREFEQMELEFFIRPDEAVELIRGRVASLADKPDLSQPQDDWGWEVWHKYWVEQRMAWYRAIGLPAASLVEYWQPKAELAHYARACVDIQYAFPFGVQELEGIAARGDFDLTQHHKHSGKPMEVFDEQLKLAAAGMDAAARAAFTQRVTDTWSRDGRDPEAARAFAALLLEGKYIPHVIEPSAGVDRLALALLCNAYAEEQVAGDKGKTETRTVLRFYPSVAPVMVAVFPLVKNKPELYKHARGIFDALQRRWCCFWDESGAIGRRYRRQDEIGTPFCVTVDFQTLEDGTMTLRDRDSMQQERLTLEALKERLDGLTA